MKKTFIFVSALFFANSAMATTDHYFLRDDHHIHHLKITKLNDNVFVSTDVDFEPNANEADGKPCSAEIAGEAKTSGENQISLKKHSHSDASYCELTIKLSGEQATIEQSKGCDNFVTGICHFSSDGKALNKIK
ncbi:MAG: hypothetical protein CTY29_03720 [Methylobacter sp.]|nr:MAG: hypothetical protein CTY29_03720 [Methylobacter sp.]PPD19901.1 MAG: hypothetical protein CTY24_10090 [Methylobacter sp.]PPD32568.1 MAG: hypothetical protein CTY18_10690 [Methylomonas sp.]